MPARRWGALFHVEPGEDALVGSLLATSFVLGISLVLLRTAGDTLFLAWFRAEDLPYAFFATLVLVPVAGVVYNRLHQWLGDTWMAGLGLGFLAAGSGLLYVFLVTGDARWAAALLRVFVEVANALAALTFWGPVASLLTLRQAKHLYPLIGTGELVAGILGGVAVTPLVRFASVEQLVLLAAAFGALAGVMLIGVLGANRRQAEPEDRQPEEGEARRGLLRTVARDRYLLLIALSYVFYYVSYELLRYVNVVQIEARFLLDTAAMASFFGALAAVRTLLVLGVRTFASGRLIARYGIGLGLLSLPTVQIGGALVLLVVALGGGGGALLFWAVILLGVIEEVVRAALNKPAVLLLYRPLTNHRRNLTQTVVETFVDPGATALVGVLILGLGAALATATVSTKVAGLTALMLVALVALLVVFALLYREYTKAVVDALSRGHLKSTRPPLNQPGAIEVAATHLSSDNTREVLYALRVLEKLVDGDRLIAMLGGLLAHPSAEVRRGALGLVERRRLGALRASVLERLRDERVPEVRGATARAVAALEEDEATTGLVPLFDDPSPDVRRGAIEALLRYAGVPGAMAAGETLRQLAASAEPAHRAEAAEIVGAVALPGYTALLRHFLADTDLGVRRAALGAIGRTRNLSLLPVLIDALDDHAVRAAAARALVAAGAAALPALGALLADARVPVAKGTRAAEAVGRIGGADGPAILRKHLDHPVREVRARIVAGLRISAWREPGETAPGIHERIAAEVEEAVGLAAAKADVAAAEGAELVVAALDRELERSRDLVLSLLSLIHPAQPILWARRHLARADPDKRAYALEVVETICPRPVREVFLPLLETDDPAEILRRLRPRAPVVRMSAEDRLRALAARNHPGATAWLATSARHAIAGKLDGDSNMKLTVEKVILLKATEFFSTIEDDILAEVATTLVEQTAAPGERIIEQGESGSNLFLIVSGRLRVHNGTTVIARVGPGQVVGDLSALVPDVRAASVTAEEETSLLRMDHSTLMDLIEEHTEVGYGIIRFLVRRFREQTPFGTMPSVLDSPPLCSRSSTSLQPDAGPPPRWPSRGPCAGRAARRDD